MKVHLNADMQSVYARLAGTPELGGKPLIDINFDAEEREFVTLAGVRDRPSGFVDVNLEFIGRGEPVAIDD